MPEIGEATALGLAAALVAPLAVAACARSLRLPDAAVADLDPGLTTELALFVTCLVGVLAVQTPALGTGAAVVVATLLAARERLHRFATQALSEAELHDALILAAPALVLLPLMPATAPVALQPWVPVAPRTLLLTVVLILALQAAGHGAGRLFGAGAAAAGATALWAWWRGGTGTAQQHIGTLGVLGGSLLAAPADAHAPVAALATLQSAGTLTSSTLVHGALLAVAAHATTRSPAAFTAAGRRYGLAVAGAQLLSTGTAALVAFR